MLAKTYIYWNVLLGQHSCKQNGIFFFGLARNYPFVLCEILFD